MNDISCPDIEASLADDFQRQARLISDGYRLWDAPSPSLNVFDILRAHYIIVDFCIQEKIGDPIGAVGPRELGLLLSCVDRQFVSLGDNWKWDTGFDRIATLLYGVVKDHPFYDANKRTAFIVSLYFLETIGHHYTPRPEILETLILGVAKGSSRIRRRAKTFMPDPDWEVLFLSDHFRRNSRPLDKQIYNLTYRQFNNRLREFGYRLENPHGNYIDVIREVERRKIFGIAGPRERTDVKVGKIGFPGWSRQIRPAAAKGALKMAGLTAKDGVDSATFFKGRDPIYYLISKYKEPVRRLANK